MKNFINTLFSFSIWILALAYFSIPVSAQLPGIDFTSEQYTGSILNICASSNGKLDREAVLNILQNQENGHGNQHKVPFSSRGDTLFLEPHIAVTPYDSTHVSFNYFSTVAFVADSLLVSFPENPDWIDSFTIDFENKTINITIQPNDTIVSISTQVVLKGFLSNGDSLSDTGYILQLPAPQQFILVSPKYMIVSAAYDTTDFFSVAHFDISGWEAVFDDSWLWVDSSTLSQTKISFVVSANTGFQERRATVVIQDSLNPVINDTLTIIQYVDAASYIIATPASSFIDSSATTVRVCIDANIAWKIEYTAVPGDMIGDSTISLNADSVYFNVTRNTTGSSRSANISIKDTLGLNVSAIIQIVQSDGQPPSYLVVYPKINFPGPEDPVVELNVAANVEWVPKIFKDPDNILSPKDTTDTSFSYNLSVNTSSATRSAVGYVESPDGSVAADTFRIIQQGSFIVLDPSEKLLPCVADSFFVAVTRYNVADINISSSPYFADVEIINNDTIKLTVNENPGTTSRNDTLIVCSNSNSAICDTMYVFQYACNQPYVLISPREQVVNWDETSLRAPFMVTSHLTGLLSVESLPGSGWVIPSISNDSLVTAQLEVNSGTTARTGKIRVWANSNTDVADTVEIIQGRTSPYIVITPNFRSLPFSGGFTEPFVVTTSNIPAWQVYFEEPVDWILDTLINGNHVSFLADNNDSVASRQVTFQVRSFPDTTFFATATIFQNGAPVPEILLSPRQQTIGHNGNDSVDFQVTAINLPGWVVVPDPLPYWILIDSAGGNLLSLDVLPNDLLETRQATIFVEALNNPAIRDSVIIYQYSAMDKYLLMAPRERTVSAVGSNNVDFDVTAVNVAEWLVAEDTIPDWITINIDTGDLLRVNVEANPDFETRQATIWIFDNTDPEIKDSVFVFQYAAPDTLLLAQPRERSVAWQGNPNLEFLITQVNLDSWEVDASSIPGWIDVIGSGNASLNLNVHQNNALETQIATIKIFGTDHPGVTDSVRVFQYSVLDSFLIAAPREKKIGFEGVSNLVFEISRANVSAWEVDTDALPAWIEVNNFGADQLDLKIFENETLNTQRSAVRIFASDNPAIEDSVIIYQYAAADTYILAAPREQQISHEGNDNVSFNITETNNLPAGWEVDLSTVPADWITVIGSGGVSLNLDVNPNTTLETRVATIRIFATGLTDVEDFVTIYQYAGLSFYLMAEPREKKIGFEGTNNIIFEITKANISAWEVDTDALPAWIEVNEFGVDQLDLKILENNSFETRRSGVRVFATANPSVEDSVIIFQYATTDSYILAAPREQRISHAGNANVSFDVTTTNNLPSGWEVDPLTVPNDWITVIGSGGVSLNLDVDANNTLLTRVATIRIFATGLSGVEDFVTVYQYSGNDFYLLASPREQKVAHTGDPNLVFEITSVNIGAWQVDENTLPAWITVEMLGSALLELNVAENDLLSTRNVIIRLFAMDNPAVEDFVSVYQYAGISPYILVSPREQEIPNPGGDLMPFDIITHNVDSWDFSRDVDWMDVVRLNEQLLVSVDTNSQSQSRTGIITIFSESDVNTFDQVSVFQGSNSEPYLVIQPAAYDTISADGQVLSIKSFSNVENYRIYKEPARPWYEISDTVGTLNDSIYLTVAENQSSYLPRSSYLTYKSLSGNVVKYFYFQQRQNIETIFVKISGQILINGEVGNPLVGDTVFVGVDTAYTDNEGRFSKEVLNGWRGAITPKIDNHFFQPANYVFNQEVYDPVFVQFAAIPINPQVSFSVSEASICLGQSLTPVDNDYPNATISGTYGPVSYKWLSDYFDPGINYDSTNVLVMPDFSPDVSTTYKLVMYNYGTSDTATFVLSLFDIPNAKDFSGPDTVCSNQAGVIYTVSENWEEGEYFSWQLSGNGGTFICDSSNISIINWGSTSGAYELSLFTHNKNNCSQSPVVKTIVVTSSLAPPATTIKKKTGDNMLLCSDSVASRYEWGWYEMVDGKLGAQYILEGKNDWYCRLPHEFDQNKYNYFVITYYEGLDCGSLTFYNPPVGIEETPPDEFMIFPNPSNGTFNIRFPQIKSTEAGSLEIYSLAGQLVYSQVLSGVQGGQTIAISETKRLEKGLYFVRFRGGKVFYNSKIIVQ